MALWVGLCVLFAAIFSDSPSGFLLADGGLIFGAVMSSILSTTLSAALAPDVPDFKEPDIPDFDDPAIKEAADRQKRLQQRGGRSSTILTGNLGLGGTESTNTMKTPVLGG